MAFRIFRTHESIFIENTESPGTFHPAKTGFSFNELFTHTAPAEYVADCFDDNTPGEPFPSGSPLQPPLGDQEVWASGVTYFRSRTARMEEAESAGGDVFYDKVYDAERPELFFKSSPHRVHGHLDHVGIRSDSTWDVPEPEFTLVISSGGSIFGYTIGNDMSSRSIEGENPLYLPQAKSYTGACSLGPCLVVGEMVPKETGIRIVINRDGTDVFSGNTSLAEIKRSFEELAGFLYRCNDFRHGTYLMTGTGIVPDSDFTLKEGDTVSITIDSIGTLTNTVETVS